MKAKNGDTVRVHYTGSLEDGTVFDSSRDRDPLEATLGQATLIPGFENAVLGLAPGDTVTVRIPPEEAYGPREEAALISVPLEQFPSHLTPEPGMMLQIATDEGEMDMRVDSVTEHEAILDGNHPLAGETLLFTIELVEILP